MFKMFVLFLACFFSCFVYSAFLGPLRSLRPIVSAFC